MRVAKLTIRNILGIESLELQPGAVTTITGKNGSGKTSILEAIRGVIAGGHDATLIRQGQEAGEVVMVLEDGTEVRKRVGPKGSTLSARDGDGKKLPEPKALIERLIDSISANPVQFLTAPPARRAQYLLDVMPVSIDTAKLCETLGGDWWQDYLPAGRSGLDALDAVRKGIYDDRTGINRAAKELRAAAVALSQQMPPGDPAAIKASLTGARQRLAEMQGEQASAAAKLSAAIGAKRSELSGDYDAAKKDLQTRYVGRIRDLEAELNRLRGELAEGERSLTAMAKEQMADAERELREQSAQDAARLAEHASAAQADVARLEEQHQAHIRAAETARLVKEQTSGAEAKEEASRRLSDALQQLDAYRQSLLEALPVPGLEVKDGDIYVGGVPFDRLNTAKKVQIALRVARLRAGDVPLVLVDGLEALDPQTFEMFESAAAKAGLQFIVTRVSEGPLTVNVRNSTETQEVA